MSAATSSLTPPAPDNPIVNENARAEWRGRFPFAPSIDKGTPDGYNKPSCRKQLQRTLLNFADTGHFFDWLMD